jgi:hypothetical protein
MSPFCKETDNGRDARFVIHNLGSVYLCQHPLRDRWVVRSPLPANFRECGQASSHRYPDGIPEKQRIKYSRDAEQVSNYQGRWPIAIALKSEFRT